MKVNIKKVYPAGWKVEFEDQAFYVGEFGQFGCYKNDGVVYKDKAAFETGNGVCYINEYGFDNSNENMSKLFEFCAKEAMASNIVGNSYTSDTGYTRADLEALCNGTNFSAEELFAHLDWMAPETLIDEWLEEEEEENDTARI